MFINPSQFKGILLNASEHLLFFQDLKRQQQDSKVIETLIDRFYYIQLSEKQVLYNIGDKDTNLYILLKGKLEVQMDIDDIMVKVKTLKPIETFNEISILSKYSKKNQTIIATSYTILAVLDRLHYIQLFGRIKQEIIDNKISQLQLFSCFESWTYGLFRKFSFYLTLLECDYNQIIFKEGDESEFIYIIHKGEFQMLKTIFIDNSIKQQKTLCLLNKGQIIGEECFLSSLFELPKIECPQITESINRYSTVKCKSLNGTLYRIKKSDISECQWDALTRYNFEQLLNQLKNFRLQRFKELQEIIKQQQKIQQNLCYQNEQTYKLIEIKTYRNIKYLKQEQFCTSSPKAQKQKNKIKFDAFDLKEIKPKIQMVSSTNRTTTNIDTNKICNNILKKLNSIREPESPLMKNRVITRKRTFHKQLSVQQSQRKKTNQSVGQFDVSEDYGDDFDIKEFIYEKRQFLANAQIRHQKNNRI